MKIEDFYKSIKICNESEDFSEINHLIEKQKFVEESGYLKMFPGTRLYLEKFRTFGDKGFVASRNLVALFFPVFWCLYRRMYFFVLLTIGFGLTLNYLDPKITRLTILVCFLYQFIFSLFANSLYFWNAKRRWKKGKTSKPFGELLFYAIILVLFLAIFKDFIL